MKKFLTIVLLTIHLLGFSQRPNSTAKIIKSKPDTIIHKSSLGRHIYKRIRVFKPRKGSYPYLVILTLSNGYRDSVILQDKYLYIDKEKYKKGFLPVIIK
jgi:hypothetical protein